MKKGKIKKWNDEWYVQYQSTKNAKIGEPIMRLAKLDPGNDLIECQDGLEVMVELDNEDIPNPSVTSITLTKIKGR
jgi:hypothetical protein